MSRQKKQRKSLESTGEHSAAGKQRGRSKQSKRRQDNEDTTCSPIQLELKKFGQQLSTPELAPVLSCAILIDKSPPLSLSTPMPKSSPKSEEGLTSNASGLMPYWCESCFFSIRRIIVAHKDRFARFGFDHFKWLCSFYGCEIVVLNETALSPEREMVEDVRREVVRLVESIP